MSQQDVILPEGWDGYGSPPASVAYILSQLWNAQLNLPSGGGGGGGGDITGLAPINSPNFTGVPTAPTPPISDNSARLATTAMVQAALALVSAGLDYLGTWNAATNTPTLSNSSGISNSGGFYIVAVAGTTNLNGVATWAVGDWCISDDVGWKKISQTDTVASVFGRTGNVTASPGDYNADQVSETATNKILTAAERTKLAGIATGATVNATDAQLRDRATHTGTQTIATVTGLQATLDAKPSTVFGRTGAVVAVSGDYNADQVTETTTHKLLTDVERAKLAGIAPDATANSTDAQLRNRATHTGTQATSTVTGLDAALALLAPKAGPTFTDPVTVPTLPAGTSDSRAASTAMVQAALAATSGGTEYLGTWNASTNTPTLSNGSGIGNPGGFYVVSVAGSTSLDGVSSWAVNDWAISDQVGWKKIVQTNAVASVFGRTGAVTAALADYNADQITETAGNKILTAAERTKLAGVATGATANSTDAQLRDRTTHTGVQAIATVTGLQTALDGKTTSVFGRTGVVLATTGDYTADQITETAGGKILTAAERTKLAGVAVGATANSTDAQLRDRTTHTGVQAIATVTGLQTALDGIPVPATVAPLVAGTAAVGATIKYAREDHVHPAQAVPTPASVAPLAPAASAVVGTSALYARQDHVHPQQDLTPYVKADGTVSFTGQITVPDGTASTKAVNKGQLDTAIAGVSGGGGTLAAGWAGTGSVARTMQELFLDIPLSAGSFGAVANGSTDDTAALQLLINNTPAGQTVQLDGGKFYGVTGLTLQPFTKLNGNGCVINAIAGATSLITIPTGTPLQTANRLLIENVQLDGQDIAGVRGINMLNHASVVIQNVGVKRCDVGIYIVGAQFGTMYSVRLWDNIVGLYLRGHPTAGGANSWSFYDLSCVGNTVGMIVNRAEYFTSHSNYFRNPVLLDNSVCAAAFFNPYDCILDGLSNELNADGAATHVFDGLTIKKSSIYVTQGHVQLVNPHVSEANANPCILVENGGSVTAIGTITGYGETTGHLIQCDATSIAKVDDVLNAVGTMDLPAGIHGAVNSRNCAYLLPATTFITDSVPNDISDPYMSSTDHTGTVSATTVTDTEMGSCRQIVFTAGTSSASVNRARFNIPVGSAGRRAVAFSVMSATDTMIGVDYNGNVDNKFVYLKAGIWRRVLYSSDVCPAGSVHVHIWAPNADGPTVRFTRWQSASGPIAHKLIGVITAMAHGALNAPVTGGGGGTPSSATPQPLGTAAAGSSTDYSRGDHVHAFPKLSWSIRGSMSPATAAAARSFDLGASTPGEQLPTYTFSGTADNSMDFYGMAPAELAAGDVTVSFYVFHLTGTSNASDWTVGLRRLAGSSVVASFTYPSDTAATGTLTANVPAKLTFTIAAADVGVLAGETFILRVKRSGTSDTLADSLRMMSFSLEIRAV